MTPQAWLESLPGRHAAAMTRSEFLKAIRALSNRYVERHGTLFDRSPLDSAGKRAAFAAFYAPLHFVTAREVLAKIGTPAGVKSILDAGCGTGVTGAAWALAARARGESPTITGVDVNHWVLDEARDSWRALDLDGRVKRADVVSYLGALASTPARDGSIADMGIACGWSLNELDPRSLEAAGRAIDGLAAKGARVLIIEPISRSLVPWWNDWAVRVEHRAGRAADWRFVDVLPPFLSALSDEAGFARAELTARSLTVNWTS